MAKWTAEKVGAAYRFKRDGVRVAAAEVPAEVYRDLGVPLPARLRDGDPQGDLFDKPSKRKRTKKAARPASGAVTVALTSKQRSLVGREVDVSDGRATATPAQWREAMKAIGARVTTRGEYASARGLARKLAAAGVPTTLEVVDTTLTAPARGRVGSKRIIDTRYSALLWS